MGCPYYRCRDPLNSQYFCSKTRYSLSFGNIVLYLAWTCSYFGRPYCFEKLSRQNSFSITSFYFMIWLEAHLLLSSCGSSLSPGNRSYLGSCLKGALNRKETLIAGRLSVPWCLDCWMPESLSSQERSLAGSTLEVFQVLPVRHLESHDSLTSLNWIHLSARSSWSNYLTICFAWVYNQLLHCYSTCYSAFSFAISFAPLKTASVLS